MSVTLHAQVERARLQWGEQVTPELWIPSMGLALCHQSDAKNSEVTTRFSADLWITGVSKQSPID
jgi:hypothetical protein